MRERELRLASHPCERAQPALAVIRMNKNIEILGVAPDAGVALERVGAADQKRYVGFVHRDQDAAIKVMSDAAARGCAVRCIHVRTSSRPIPLPLSARPSAGTSSRR